MVNIDSLKQIKFRDVYYTFIKKKYLKNEKDDMALKIEKCLM